MPSYYTARSDDELRRLAEQQYQSYYDQLRTAARQKQERESLALENQRAGIQRSFEKKREASDKSYRQAYSQTDRETLRRGMQRSSYAAQRLANVSQEGIEASQNIWDEQNEAEGNLDAQIAQTQGQLADALAGYDANQAADVLKRYNELQAEEYDRAREAEQYAESIRQWQSQFDESVRQFNVLHPEPAADGGGGGGGGYSRSRSRSRSHSNSNNNNSNNPAGTTDAAYEAFLGETPASTGTGWFSSVRNTINNISKNNASSKPAASAASSVVKPAASNAVSVAKSVLNKNILKKK